MEKRFSSFLHLTDNLVIRYLILVQKLSEFEIDILND